MGKRVSVDKWLFTVTLLLVFAGLVMVFSASAVMAKEHYNSAYYFLLRQFFWACAGLVAMYVLMNVDYRRFRAPAVVFSTLGLTVLLLLSVFFLDRSHNTHRWFRLGPLSFQPSELAKLTLILFLAWLLEQKAKAIEDWHNLVAPVAVTMILAGLIAAQPDLGTAIVCFAIACTMLLVAGVRLSYYLYPLALSPLAFYFLVWRVHWRRERILAFANPFNDPQGRGFHIIQSLIAVGTGGLAGVGLMEGKQKLFYLPEPHTDFIFAVTAEELGLLGWLVIVALFGVFCYRGHPCRRAFARSLCALSGDRHYRYGGDSGTVQHQRGAGHAAYQGHSLAVYLLRRFFLVHDPWCCRCASQHYAANGLMMRIVIAGGGTGGHVIPALAIAHELRAQYSAEVIFVGTARGIETRLVPAAGYRLRLIQVGALKKVSIATRLKTLTDLPRAILTARSLLSEFRPGAVIGVGGYASGPAMLAAVIAGVPTLAFEPNRVPGFTNRLVGVMVSAAAVQFEQTCRYFSHCRVTGVPVRHAFFEIGAKPPGTPPTLLVFGGSQGAHAINQAVLDALPAFSAEIPGLHLIHQTGERDYNEAQAAYLQAGVAAEICPFIDDMPGAFARADLLLCRAGASTVAEITAAGKAAVFVPFPHAADDHQRRNAETLVEAGAGVLVPNEQLTPERLVEVVRSLLCDRVRLAKMSAAARGLAHPDAAAEIARLAARLAGNSD